MADGGIFQEPHAAVKSRPFPLTERAYKAAALTVRPLNVSSRLTAYQAELCEDMATKPEPVVWEVSNVILGWVLWAPF